MIEQRHDPSAAGFRHGIGDVAPAAVEAAAAMAVLLVDLADLVAVGPSRVQLTVTSACPRGRAW